MNKQELQGAFSRLHASEGLMKEVLSVENENKRTWDVRRTLWRVAAVAAAVAILATALVFWPVNDEPEIIAVPGVLKVYACELEDMDSVQIAEYALIEGDTSYKSAWCPYINLICGGITLSFLTEDESLEEHKITYDISANYGEIVFDGYQDQTPSSKSGTIDNGGWILWTGYEVMKLHSREDTTDMVKEKTGGVYLDAIIKADGNIVGYAVFEIVCTFPNFPVYNAVLLHSVFYPKVDGEFQMVTDEYVAEQIANTKAA